MLCVGKVDLLLHSSLTWQWVEVDSQLHTSATLPLGIGPLLPIALETEWAPKLVCMFWKIEISPAPCQESSLNHAAHSFITKLTKLYWLLLD